MSISVSNSSNIAQIKKSAPVQTPVVTRAQAAAKAKAQAQAQAKAQALAKAQAQAKAQTLAKAQAQAKAQTLAKAKTPVQASAPAKTQAKVSTPAPLITKTPVTANQVKPASTPAAPAATTAASPSSSGGGFIADQGDVIVNIEHSDSGYSNKIYFSTDNFATRTYLGIDNETGTYNIGSFAKGTKVDFGIDNGQGQFFKTGAASANPDNIVHALTTEAGGTTQIGFEDLYGGGDRDFNDAILTVRSLAKPDDSQGAATTPAANANTGTSPSNDNRSGLGDGTNPGQGEGTANSPNQGTNNPGIAAYLGNTPSSSTISVFA